MNKSRFITNSFYYTLAPLLRNFLAFITLPIMTRYLLPKDYGILCLITMITSFSAIIYVGLNSATIKYYFKYKDDDIKLQRLISSNILYILAASILFLVALATIFPLLNYYLFDNKLTLIWVVLAFLQYAIAYVNLINQTILQNQHRGKVWFLNEFFAIIVQVSLSIALIVSKIFTFEAVIIAGLIAEIVKSGATFFQVRKYYALIYDYSFLKESLIYSWPQVPTALFSYVYLYLDRVLINRFQGLSQVGILDMSNRISNILKMSSDGIGGALTPLTLALLTENSKESLNKLANINLKVIFGMLFFALSIILFTKEIVNLLTTKEYHYVINIIPLYIYYHVFGILGLISYWLIYNHHNKTILLIPFSIGNFIISSVANIILIPKYGVMGAAIATFVSSMCIQVAQFIVGLKLTPIPINVGKVAIMFTLTVIITGLLYLLYYLQLFVIVGIIIKMVLLFSFVFICYRMEIFSFEDIKEIISGAKCKIISKYASIQ
jgi:O-antigen/teichoic acid export membrane protein